MSTVLTGTVPRTFMAMSRRPRLAGKGDDPDRRRICPKEGRLSFDMHTIKFPVTLTHPSSTAARGMIPEGKAVAHAMSVSTLQSEQSGVDLHHSHLGVTLQHDGYLAHQAHRRLERWDGRAETEGFAVGRR